MWVLMIGSLWQLAFLFFFSLSLTLQLQFVYVQSRIYSVTTM